MCKSNGNSNPPGETGPPRLPSWTGGVVAAILICVLGLGCASSNVNPATARARTGYVDFYAVNDTELSWEIRQLDSDGGSKRIFADFDPLPEKILRLAFKPGQYRLSVTTINRSIVGPGVVEVEVAEGQVTPVRVTLLDAGTGQVWDKKNTLRIRVTGSYGRATTVTGQETQLFQLQVESTPGLPYQPKAQMPYAN